MSPQTDETAPVESSAPTDRKSARKPRARKVAKRRRRSSPEVQGRAEQLLRQGKRVVNKAYDWAGEAGRAVPRLTNQLRLSQRSDLDDLTNPLVVGAIGVGIGVVLGTLMPQMVTSSQKLPRGGKRSRHRRG